MTTRLSDSLLYSRCLFPRRRRLPIVVVVFGDVCCHDVDDTSTSSPRLCLLLSPARRLWPQEVETSTAGICKCDGDSEGEGKEESIQHAHDAYPTRRLLTSTSGTADLSIAGQFA
ncbi:hypothetical protein DFP72DRAFT_1171535 [Ephemerocybe angulata]|uniref:Uncharacterized protein n=1 Tax=Ephemerocybe angulata TaxID=980116 RepID=A0A8H6HVQ3_9AGAR|nr:hypothetical protein DFP72DRAFT_1171535 [Tulosesus angulatus]